MKIAKTWKRAGVILCICLLLCPSAAALAKTASSKSVKLSSYTGSVEVKKGTTKFSKLKAGMRLFDGYSIITSKASYAYLELDSSKFIKIDQTSNIKIKKNGKKNDILIHSGAIFFNVTKPLKSDESLNVKTSNMTMGVRGTSGSVIARPVYEKGKLSSISVDVQIYTGAGYVTLLNESTKEVEKYQVEPGKVINIQFDLDTEHMEISIRNLKKDASEIPYAALMELIGQSVLLKEIAEKTGINEDAIKKALQDAKKRENQELEEQERIFENEKEKFVQENKQTVIYDKEVKSDGNSAGTNASYKLIYQAGRGGRISGAASQKVEAGKDGAQVTAIPDKGYQFKEWSDGREEAVRQDEEVKKDITVTAIFEAAEGAKEITTQEELMTALKDSGVKQIIIPAGSAITLQEDMTVQEGRELLLYSPLTLSNNISFHNSGRIEAFEGANLIINAGVEVDNSASGVIKAPILVKKGNGAADYASISNQGEIADIRGEKGAKAHFYNHSEVYEFTW